MSYQVGWMVRNYGTNFDATENPISENGSWQHTDPNQTVVKTVGGSAYGTQNSGDAAPPYLDASAYLLGFGANCEVEAIISLAGGLDSTNRESEILLRWSEGALRTNPGGYGDTHCTGYEINVQHQGAYLQCGLFKSTNLVNMALGATPANGDKFRARIEGTRIRCWWNDVLKFDINDSTYATGNPGIGFFIHQGATNTDFGFSSVTVRQL